MKQYLELMEHIKNNGVQKGDRTGTGTVSVFGYQMSFDLREGFPLLTTKKLHLKSIIHELLWFLDGGTETGYLNDNGVKIWDAWALDGDLGPVYGKQWRSWAINRITHGEVGSKCIQELETIDQIDDLIYMLNNNPDSRRMIVSAWNPADLPDEKFSPQTNVRAGRMALAPCHLLFQVYTEEMTLKERVRWAEENRGYVFPDQIVSIESVEKELELLDIPTRFISLQMYQRSADVFLGVPFNIASYSLLLMMIGQCVNMVPKNFVHTLGDAHLYNNHLDQVSEQLSRKPRALPVMKLYPHVKDIDGFKYEHFMLSGYEPDDHIAAPISV